MISSATENTITIVAGLLSHWLWFVHGEHDNYAGIYVRVYLGLEVLLVAIYYQLAGLSLWHSVSSMAYVARLYFAALFCSMLIYRIVLSPLRHIPGPLPLKISKLYHTWNIRGLDNFRFLDKIHHQHGDVVRTGPDEVTLFNAEGFEKVYGPDSRCTKAIFYDAPRPVTSLVNTRDIHEHTRWRKVWDQAFSQKALDSYEPVVFSYGQQLIDWLDGLVGQPVEISSCFERYTFDILGKLGLDLDFRLLKGQQTEAAKMYRKSSPRLAVLTSIPWSIHVAGVFPFLKRDLKAKLKWIGSELEKRKGGKQSLNSIIDHIIADAEENGGFEANSLRLHGDFLLVLAAGNDPMMKCLTNIMYYLAKDRKRLSQLRAELAGLNSLSDYKQLMRLPFLNACIYETLRLNPSIPASGSRKTPPEGIEVSGIYIPGNTVVSVPQHSVFRRDDCFTRPLEYIPERWTTEQHLVLNKMAYQPWSSGRYSCVGKHLGLMEIRIAAALIVDRYDWQFAEGHDPEQMFSQMIDSFVSFPGPLHVVLTHRER